MAHPVDLEAKLNTQQAEQKLNNLANKASKKLESPASPISKGIDGLSDSLKKFRNVIGGGVIAQSLGQLAKSMDLFGDKTDKLVNQFTGTFNHMLGAIASGNPVVIAMTAAMEALMYTFQQAAKERDQAIAGLNEQNSRVMKWQDFKAGVADYRQGQQIQGAIASGDTAEMRSWLEVMKTRRANVEESINTGLEKGWTKDRAGDLDKLVSKAQKYDSVVKQLEDALKKQEEATQKATQAAIKQVTDVMKAAAEARQKRQEELSAAKERFQYSEDFKSAVQSRDTAWLEDAFGKAVERMQSAKTASEFNAAAGQATQARDALKNISQEDLTSLQDQLKTLIGISGPVSGFTAAGFSMGEQFSPVDNISRNVEQIVMLMREQMQKSLASYNTGKITL